MFRRIIPITVIILLALSTSSFGQLTKADIDSLRQLGEQEGWTFIITENEATKRPISELCGLVPPDDPEPEELMGVSMDIQALPSAWDWRDLDGVTPVRNQGGCGSCWAFGTVGALECAIKIWDGQSLDLSEQWLLDCNQEGWSCNGGWWAHSYHMIDTKTDPCGGFGPVYESELPYVAFQQSCNCPYHNDVDLCIQNWGYVGGSSSVTPTDAIKQAILIYGPVSVGVYASAAMQAYGGGIFNSCINDMGINHAVVLVGWDDSMGSSGVWILRNSWGPGWGVDGYMYIEYGCNLVGYGTSYIDYDVPKVAFWADTTYGPMPLDVNFDATTRISADSWSWDFGDGGSAGTQAAFHTFNQRGAFDVTVEITDDAQTYQTTKNMYIVAYADTVTGADAIGNPNQTVVVTLSAYNSAPIQRFKIPVEFPAGDFAMVYDSFNTDGCRTDYFEYQDYVHNDWYWNRRLTLDLRPSIDGSQEELTPGEGAIAKLYFTMPASATEGQTTALYMDGYNEYVPEFIGSAATYQVPGLTCQVTCSEACCQNRGDVDHDGTVNESDVVFIVDWAFSSGPTPPCAVEAEIDGSSGVNIDDLLYLVDYIYNAGPAPPACP